MWINSKSFFTASRLHLGQFFHHLNFHAQNFILALGRYDWYFSIIWIFAPKIQSLCFILYTSFFDSSTYLASRFKNLCVATDESIECCHRVSSPFPPPFLPIDPVHNNKERKRSQSSAKPHRASRIRLALLLRRPVAALQLWRQKNCKTKFANVASHAQIFPLFTTWTRPFSGLKPRF